MTIINALPFNLQNGTTADATQVMANFDEILNDTNNNAAHNGVNSDITALTALTTPLTPAQGGSSIFYGAGSGTANVQLVTSTTPIGFSLAVGNRVVWLPSVTNTGPMTLQIGATTATAVTTLTGSGPEPCVGGEVITGQLAEAIYDGTQFILVNDPMAVFSTVKNLASATTTDLGTALSHLVNITGTTTITAFGSSASLERPLYKLVFSGSLTLTYNATSLLLPGAANIQTSAGSTADALYLGSGDWQVLSYFPANGTSVVNPTPLGGAIGLVIANNVSTPNTNIDVAADQAVMLTTTGVSISGTGIAVTINTTTTGANGLDTGSRANSTWYNLYLISNGTVVAGLASLSATSPTLPSGYIYKVRLGAMRTDSSGNFLRTRQIGRDATYTLVTASNTTALPQISGGSQTAWTAFTVQNVTVPATATKIKIVLNAILTANSNTFAAVVPNNNYPSGLTGNVYPIAFGGNANATTIAVAQIPGEIVLESASIYVGTIGTFGTVTTDCYGWTDKVNAC